MDRDQYQKELLEALRHLYNPSWLHGSPLLTLFPIGDRSNPADSFQCLIVEAIQAMQPGTHVPLQSDAWRAYHVLKYRFVEGSSQRVVAANMALSERQLRREEHQAIQLLGNYLWEHYQLGTVVSEPATESVESSSAVRDNELNWLLQSQPFEKVAIHDLINSALHTVSSLLKSTGIKVEFSINKELPPITGQVGLLRQALVNLLTASVQPLNWKRLSISARAEEGTLILRFEGKGNNPPSENHDTESLEMVAELVRLFGGTLEDQMTTSPQVIEFVLPIKIGIPVLVVDDNADAHQLIKRYLTGSPYHLTGTRDPEEALKMVKEQQPRVVLLDIMLPGRDGWEILAQLRENPSTRRIPVVICTIMPQEQLALSLGAAAFLRKPVMQEDLLRTLDSLTDRLLPKSG